MKKIISLLLSIIMILSAFSVTSVSVFAGTIEDEVKVQYSDNALKYGANEFFIYGKNETDTVKNYSVYASLFYDGALVKTENVGSYTAVPNADFKSGTYSITVSQSEAPVISKASVEVYTIDEAGKSAGQATSFENVTYSYTVEEDDCLIWIDLEARSGLDTYTKTEPRTFQSLEAFQEAFREEFPISPMESVGYYHREGDDGSFTEGTTTVCYEVNAKGAVSQGEWRRDRGWERKPITEGKWAGKNAYASERYSKQYTYKNLVVNGDGTVSVDYVTSYTGYKIVQAKGCKASASVFDSNGKMVRTLYYVQPRTPGTYYETWDGRDDYGNLCPDGDYVIKVATNSVEFELDTVVGNTSYFDGDLGKYMGSYHGFSDMVYYENLREDGITDKLMYYADQYMENTFSASAFLTEDPNHRADRFSGQNRQHRKLDSDGKYIYYVQHEGSENGVFAVNPVTNYYLYTNKYSLRSGATGQDGKGSNVGSVITLPTMIADESGNAIIYEDTEHKYSNGAYPFKYSIPDPETTATIRIDEKRVPITAENALKYMNMDAEKFFLYANAYTQSGIKANSQGYKYGDIAVQKNGKLLFYAQPESRVIVSGIKYSPELQNDKAQLNGEILYVNHLDIMHPDEPAHLLTALTTDKTSGTDRSDMLFGAREYIDENGKYHDRIALYQADKDGKLTEVDSMFKNRDMGGRIITMELSPSGRYLSVGLSYEGDVVPEGVQKYASQVVTYDLDSESLEPVWVYGNGESYAYSPVVKDDKIFLFGSEYNSRHAYIAYEGTDDRVYIGDTGNNRALVVDLTYNADGTSATTSFVREISQSIANTSTGNAIVHGSDESKKDYVNIGYRLYEVDYSKDYHGSEAKLEVMNDDSLTAEEKAYMIAGRDYWKLAYNYQGYSVFGFKPGEDAGNLGRYNNFEVAEGIVDENGKEHIYMPVKDDNLNGGRTTFVDFDPETGDSRITSVFLTSSQYQTVFDNDKLRIRSTDKAYHNGRNGTMVYEMYLIGTKKVGDNYDPVLGYIDENGNKHANEFEAKYFLPADISKPGTMYNGDSYSDGGITVGIRNTGVLNNQWWPFNWRTPNDPMDYRMKGYDTSLDKEGGSYAFGAAPSVGRNSYGNEINNPFPRNGAYNVNAHNASGQAEAIGEFLFFQWYGEFFKGSTQASFAYVYTEDGLYIGTFGSAPGENEDGTFGEQAYDGNCLDFYLTYDSDSNGDVIYAYLKGESRMSGIRRQRFSNMNSVKTHEIPVALKTGLINGVTRSSYSTDSIIYQYTTAVVDAANEKYFTLPEATDKLTTYDFYVGNIKDATDSMNVLINTDAKAYVYVSNILYAEGTGTVSAPISLDETVKKVRIVLEAIDGKEYSKLEVMYGTGADIKEIPLENIWTNKIDYDKTEKTYDLMAGINEQKAYYSNSAYIRYANQGTIYQDGGAGEFNAPKDVSYYLSFYGPWCDFTAFPVDHTRESLIFIPEITTRIEHNEYMNCNLPEEHIDGMNAYTLDFDMAQSGGIVSYNYNNSGTFLNSTKTGTFTLTTGNSTPVTRYDEDTLLIGNGMQGLIAYDLLDDNGKIIARMYPAGLGSETAPSAYFHEDIPYTSTNGSNRAIFLNDAFMTRVHFGTSGAQAWNQGESCTQFGELNIFNNYKINVDYSNGTPKISLYYRGELLGTVDGVFEEGADYTQPRRFRIAQYSPNDNRQTSVYFENAKFTEYVK